MRLTPREGWEWRAGNEKCMPCLLELRCFAQSEPRCKTGPWLKIIRELAGADWATTSVDYNATEDLEALFAKYRMGAPNVMLQADCALSVIVALAYGDLLAILPVQWNDFPLAREMLPVMNMKEKLPAPSITCIRRPDLPLTPAAEYFCDLLKRSAG